MKFITIAVALFGICSVQSKQAKDINILIHNYRELSTPLALFTASDSTQVDSKFKFFHNDGDEIDSSAIKIELINFSVNRNGAEDAGKVLSLADSKSLKLGNKGIYGFKIAKMTDTISFPIRVKGYFQTYSEKHGHLDPEEFYSFWYYKIAFVIVTAITFFWIVAMKKYQTQIVNHHYAITLVLFASLIEIILKLADLHYAKLNVCILSNARLKFAPMFEIQFATYLICFCIILIAIVNHRNNRLAHFLLSLNCLQFLEEHWLDC